MLAKLSVLGLYNYNEHLFDTLSLPAGDIINKEILIDRIIAEAAELPVRYPDYDWFQRMLGAWSASKRQIWARMYSAVTKTYNPIENYDRIEEWTDAGMDKNTGSYDIDNKSTAYNTMVPETTDTQDSSHTDTTTRNNAHSGRVHGNIGVTTNQQMLNAELDIADRLDIYDIIVDNFIDAFCIGIY